MIFISDSSKKHKGIILSEGDILILAEDISLRVKKTNQIKIFFNGSKKNTIDIKHLLQAM